MKKLIMIMLMAVGMNLFADEWYDETTGFTWTYSVSAGKATITDVSPREGVNLIFPNAVGGYVVNAIKMCEKIPYESKLIAFSGSLVLPDSLTEIYEGAFAGCSGFTSLIIPNKVITIRRAAFQGCVGFRGELIMPDSIKYIGEDAFDGCSGFFGVLKVGNGVTEIGKGAFRGCSGFTGVILPDSLTIIGENAFDGCSGFSGLLTIPNSVAIIKNSAFAGCSGLTGLLTIPDSITTIGTYAFYKCNGLSDLVTVKGTPPKGFLESSLWGKKISYLPKYGAVWQKFLSEHDGLIYDAGYIRSNTQPVSIVSSKIRETDPTVMDVVYKVTSSQPTVKVRALAFKDGVRSFENVVRPETFIEGTDANIGDGIAANVEHRLSWKVSADWQETLAKVKFEVLALDGELLPLELTTLPKTGTQPKMEVSWNVMFDHWVFDALMWLYADKDLGLILTSGVLKNGDVRLADGASVSKTMYDATVYVYGKMGYELLQGERLEYARQMLRRNLPDVSVAQYAVKVIEE